MIWIIPNDKSAFVWILFWYWRSDKSLSKSVKIHFIDACMHDQDLFSVSGSSKLRLCEWPSTAWAYSKQDTEKGPCSLLSEKRPLCHSVNKFSCWSLLFIHTSSICLSLSKVYIHLSCILYNRYIHLRCILHNSCSKNSVAAANCAVRILCYV